MVKLWFRKWSPQTLNFSKTLEKTLWRPFFKRRSQKFYFFKKSFIITSFIITSQTEPSRIRYKPIRACRSSWSFYCHFNKVENSHMRKSRFQIRLKSQYVNHYVNKINSSLKENINYSLWKNFFFKIIIDTPYIL